MTFPVSVQGQTEIQFAFTIFGYLSIGFTVLGLFLGYRNKQKISDWLFGKAKEGVAGVGSQLQRVTTLSRFSLDSKKDKDLEMGDISEPPKAYSEVYPLRLGDDFKTSVVLSKHVELADATEIIVRGVKRVVDGQETNALPSWIKYKHDKTKGVINFFSLKATDKELGQHVVVIVGAHVGEAGIEEKEYSFLIDVSNAVNEDVLPNTRYEKSLNIEQIFPDAELGDDFAVQVSRRNKSHHLIQVRNT